MNDDFIFFEDYFPHSQSASNDDKLVRLLEKEGSRGYGIYWLILEYLRSQNTYVGTTLMIDRIARTGRTTAAVVRRVLYNFALFNVEDQAVTSTGMRKRMGHLDRRRAEIHEQRSRAAHARWHKPNEIPHADAMQDKVSKDKPSIIPPSNPPSRGTELLSFWEEYKPDPEVLNVQTHNYEGIKRIMNELRITNGGQLYVILKLADYGRKNNPFWQIIARKDIPTWRQMRNPGQSLIYALQKAVNHTDWGTPKD